MTYKPVNLCNYFFKKIDLSWLMLSMSQKNAPEKNPRASSYREK